MRFQPPLLLLIALLASCSATIAGPAGGDLTGTYPNPQIAPYGVGSIGPLGGPATSVVISLDNVGMTGRVKNITTVAIAGVPPTGPAGGVLTGSYPSPSGLNATGVNNSTTFHRVRLVPTADARIQSLVEGEHLSLRMYQATPVYQTSSTGALFFDGTDVNNGWIVTGGINFQTIYTGSYVFAVTALVDGASVLNYSFNINGLPFIGQTSHYYASGQTLSFSMTVNLFSNDTVSVAVLENVFVYQGGPSFIRTRLVIESLNIN